MEVSSFIKSSVQIKLKSKKVENHAALLKISNSTNLVLASGNTSIHTHYTYIPLKTCSSTTKKGQGTSFEEILASTKSSKGYLNVEEPISLHSRITFVS